jgi:hypothetical protein
LSDIVREAGARLFGFFEGHVQVLKSQQEHRMSRVANLADPMKEAPRAAASRSVREAIASYFAPELSMALHHSARKHDLSLQMLMTEAFNDMLRKSVGC